MQLPIVIFKNRLFQTCIIVKHTCVSFFSKIGLVDQSKPCTQIYLQKKSEFIQLEFGKTTPYRHAQPSNGHSSFSSPMLTREDREYSHTIAFDGELFAYSIPYQNQFVTSQIVLFVASNKDLIATSTVFLISPALLDTTTVRMVEIAYDGGHSVMT